MVIGLVRTSEDTVVVVICTTAGIAPAFPSEISEECVVGWCDLSGGTAAGLRCGSRTRLDRVAAWESREDATDGLVDGRLDAAAFSLGVRNEVKDRAVFDTAAVVGALVNSGLEVCFIPAHDEITVAAIAGWVTHGPDEWLFASVPLVGEFVGVPDDFEEEGDQVDWKVGRAWTRVI